MVHSNFLLLILALSISLTIQSNGDQGHVCNHDSEFREQAKPKDANRILKQQKQKRNLQSVQPQPIRITTDNSQLYNQTRGDGMDYQKLDYIMKLIEVSSLYLKYFIQVIPRSEPLKSIWDKSICNGIEYPSYLLKQGSGVKNSDLHILLTYYNKDTSVLASAIWCEVDESPLIGIIRFNIGSMKLKEKDHFEFQRNVYTTLHELFHILGFSSNSFSSWIDPETKSYYDDNVEKILKKVQTEDGKYIYKLSSQNILETARQYYNCGDIDGMILENYGSGIGSHWEKDLLQSEIMTASSLDGFIQISEFTAALLRDTGYYWSINSNMVQEVFWGKGKGCDFFKNTCNSEQNYAEFHSDLKISCDFLQNGYGYQSKQTYHQQCNFVQIFGNGRCNTSSFNSPSEIMTRDNPSQQSRCFISNAKQNDQYYYRQQSQEIRCLISKCNREFTQIIIQMDENESIICAHPGQIIDISKQTKNTNGFLNCPDNFYQFCISHQPCQNDCSSNGLCIKGQCFCQNRFAGEDCSEICLKDTYLYENKCINKCLLGMFANPDNTCKSTCPMGFFKDNQERKCLICHPNCSACHGKSNHECNQCNFGYKLKNNSCIKLVCHNKCKLCNGRREQDCIECIDSLYLDTLTKQCLPCQKGCKKCLSQFDCQICEDEFILDKKQQQCIIAINIKCDITCKTCMIPHYPQKCTSCQDGYFLNEFECQKCKDPCSSCEQHESKCTRCRDGYIFNKKTDSCEIFCHKNCKDCYKSGDESACLTCHDGYYLKNYQCLKCQLPCKSCKQVNNVTICLSCISDTLYIYNHINFSCNPICHPTCKTCRQPQQQKACQSCYDGYYLTMNECKKCLSPCKNCISQLYCLSCINEIDYTFDANNSICKMKCHQTCKTCISPNNPSQCSSCFSGQYLEIISDYPLNQSNRFSQYQKSTLSEIGQCIDCIYPCKECSNQQICTKCVQGFHLFNQQCVVECNESCFKCKQPNICEICKSGYFLKNNACYICENPCLDCEEQPNKCRSCIQGYNLQDNLCKPVCDPYCLECKNLENNNFCTKCKYGFYLNISNQCEQCKYPCKECDQFGCRSCLDDAQYKFDIQQKRCIMICHQSCKQCSYPNNSKACTECEQGYYFIKDQFLKCSDKCKTCIDNEYYCTDCKKDYQLDDVNHQCIPIVCHTSFKTCSIPFDENYCITCQEGYLQIQNQNEINQKQDQNNVILIGEQNKIVVEGENLPQENQQNMKKEFKKHDSILQHKYCIQCFYLCKTCAGQIDKCTSCFDGYVLKNNTCEPTLCHNSCKTCTERYNKYSCSSCYEGYYLQAKNSQFLCEKCLDENCVECSSSNNCLKCKPNYTLSKNPQSDEQQDKNQCFPICHPSCDTCLFPLENNYCLSCKEGFLLINGQCQQCKQGYYYDGQQCLECINNCKNCKSKQECLECEDGYSYSQKEERCIQSINCHSTCLRCLDDERYTSCIECHEDRFLKLLNNQNESGVCDCKEGQTDLNNMSCQPSKEQVYLNKISTQFFQISFSSVFLIGVFCIDPITLFYFLEFSQQVSYLGYLNQKQPIGFDEIMYQISYSHFTKFANFSQLSYQIEQDNSQDNNQSIFKAKGNPKLILNEKIPYFLLNGLIILVLHFTAWLIAVILSLKLSCFQMKQKQLLKRLFLISGQIIIFVITSQELFLLVFFQYYNLRFDSNLDKTNIFLWILSQVYIILYIGYLFYKSEGKKGDTSSSATITNPFPNQDSQNDKKRNEDIYKENKLQDIQEVCKEDERFFFIKKQLKQNSFFQRNFIQIQMMSKMIISLICVVAFENPLAQAISILCIHLINTLLIKLVQPFKSIKHFRLFISIYFIISQLYLLYIFTIIYQKQQNIVRIICLVMLILIILINGAFFFYSIFLMIKIFYTYFRQATYQSFKQKIKQVKISETPQISLQINNQQQNVSNFGEIKSPQASVIYSVRSQIYQEQNIFN